MHIVGTAGHVDHGKSSLVRALTGTDPDRWIEEQVRGMTLDLGFAHLPLEGGIEAGIIDVPGHERFLHNMLAGAAGMEVLLLVVDVNEGVMPQTMEHLEILGYLNVRKTILVLSKIDLVPSSERLVRERAVTEGLRGTIAEGAPVVSVSTVTGEGLESLRARIAEALRALPPRDARAPVYVPIDRVFSLPGHGTIVTGTLMQGAVAVGDTLALEPSGKSARVRGLQIFGKPLERAEAGSRIAINLTGTDAHEIARGEVAASREFAARSSFAVRFEPLPAARALLRRRTPVRVYLGAAEHLGTLIIDGERAELQLKTPAVAFPGVRFVLRGLSPKTLLGGGYVEGAAVLHAAEPGDPAQDLVRGALSARALEPSSASEIAFAANLREEIAASLLDALVASDEAVRITRPVAYVDARAAAAFLERAVEHLRSVQTAEPWAIGATSLALSRGLGVSETLLVRLLAAFVENGRLAFHAGYYATVDHQPELSAAQKALFFEELFLPDDERPLLPRPFEEILGAVKRSRVPGASRALETLLARGALTKVGDEVYRAPQIAQIRARVEAHLQRHERMTAAEFRDLIGTSRKYAVPLLEWLDARGVTLRSGDHRVLRKKPV